MTELDRLVRRLRGFTARTWRGEGRADAVRRLAAALVEVGGSGHRLPDLPEHALADAIAVLGAEAEAVDPSATARLVALALQEARQLSRSSTIAMPGPPPTHIVSRLTVLSWYCSELTSVVVMRAPVTPNGGPTAIAPPLTLSLSPNGSMPMPRADGMT